MDSDKIRDEMCHIWGSLVPLADKVRSLSEEVSGDNEYEDTGIPERIEGLLHSILSIQNECGEISNMEYNRKTLTEELDNHIVRKFRESSK